MHELSTANKIYLIPFANGAMCIVRHRISNGKFNKLIETSRHLLFFEVSVLCFVRDKFISSSALVNETNKAIVSLKRKEEIASTTELLLTMP